MKKAKSSIFASFGRLPTLEKVYLIATLLLSVLIFAAAVSFIVSCTSIFFSAEASPFTRKIVAEHLARIAPLTVACLVLVIALGVLSLYVKAKAGVRIPLSAPTMLKITEKKLAGFTTSTVYNAKRDEEIKNRRIIAIICAAVCAVFAAVALILVVNPARYASDDFNLDIAYSAVIVLASAILAFAACFVASALLDRSYTRQNAEAKLEVARLREVGAVSMGDEVLAEGHIKLIVRAIVFVVAVVFIILGIFNGGMSDVLGKAVRICTECIGLG